jgi:hypothetical protein
MQMTLKQAKDNFFDRQVVIDAVGKANARVAMRQGGLVKTIMRRSMRRKKGPAPAGSPPHAHKGQIRDFTEFAFDPATKSMVVGPVKLGKGAAPEIQDKGGYVPVKGIFNRKGEFIALGKMNTAGRLAAIKSGKVVTIQAEVKPRPFSIPALMKAKDKLAEAWKDTLKG